MKSWECLRERLATRSEPQANGCHLWMRGKSKGYGLVDVFDRTWKAHRVAWMAHHETFLPRGAFVLHSCDTPSCVNPLHLRVGTHRENMDDRIARGPKGEKCGCSVLKAEQVRQIRLMPLTVTNRNLGEMYGVTSGAIASIRAGRTWRSVQ
jgi:HNH endonuclease